LEVLKLTSTSFIDALAAQRNVQLAEEGLAIAEAAVPVTQKSGGFADPTFRSCLEPETKTCSLNSFYPRGRRRLYLLVDRIGLEPPKHRPAFELKRVCERLAEERIVQRS
jgi:hypothetical protein